MGRGAKRVRSVKAPSPAEARELALRHLRDELDQHRTIVEAAIESAVALGVPARELALELGVSRQTFYGRYGAAIRAGRARARDEARRGS